MPPSLPGEAFQKFQVVGCRSRGGRDRHGAVERDEAPAVGDTQRVQLGVGQLRGSVQPRTHALALLDLAVEIPMVGTGASLNVAVAGSLVLYRLAGLL